MNEKEEKGLGEAWRGDGCWDGSCTALRNDGDLEVTMQWGWKMIVKIKIVKQFWTSNPPSHRGNSHR